MEPIKFNEDNTAYYKGHENLYDALPALIFEDGYVVTCWKLSFKDILRLIFTRKLWLVVATFNKPLHPIFMSTNKRDIFTSKTTKY